MCNNSSIASRSQRHAVHRTRHALNRHHAAFPRLFHLYPNEAIDHNAMLRSDQVEPEMELGRPTGMSEKRR
jgi:hypothetical protein